MSLTARDRGFGDPLATDFRKNNIVKVTAGGITVYVHKDLDLTFLCFLAELENLHGPGSLARDADDWGFICRPIRGYEQKYADAAKRKDWATVYRLLSNHSYGTAVDVNSRTNPMGPAKTTFNVAGTRALCFKYGISWGLDYRGKRKDAMHFEFLGTNADARVRKMRLAANLRTLARKG